MSYKLDFYEQAFAEWNSLDAAVKAQFKKKLAKILHEPRIVKNKLSGHPHRYKIKLRRAGYRLVYEVKDDEIVVIVIAVGRRDHDEVYQLAAKRHS